MSSGFSGGFPEFFNANGGGLSNVTGRSLSMMNLSKNVNKINYNQQVNYRSPLAGILSDSLLPDVGSGPRSELIGKRSSAEFQHQQQLQQQASVYVRNVKPRAYNQQTDLQVSPEVSSISNVSNPSSSTRYSGQFSHRPDRLNICHSNFNGVMTNYQISNYSSAKQPPVSQDMDRKMLNRLQELEKELLLDDYGENDAVSAVTDAQWSETIQKLLNPVQVRNPQKNISPSPTTSSSSSCASSSATISPKLLISDAAEAIADGKSEMAVELITRLDQISNARGTPEQRLGFYMATALRSRLRVNHKAEDRSPATELYQKEHIQSMQLVYDKSPCFKLAFMAANNIILQTLSDLDRPPRSIHVVDFDIGHGLQYVYLLYEIAAARKGDGGAPVSLKITTFKDFGNGGAERLKLVGDGLKSLSNKVGVLFQYTVLDFKLSDISKHGLAIENGEVLIVNFAFKLNKLPDESVSTENLRDQVLRRVKGLSPAVVLVAEQELNGNTASFTARVNETFSYYTTFVDSLDATIPRDSPERVKIEEGLSRRIVNSVACEGRDRVERCEVLGKWRARMRMAGFDSKPVSQLAAESLMSKLNSGRRGNPGFTVREDSGGISLGWLGRTLTVVSAWH